MSEKDIRSFCKKEIAGCKVPRKVFFVESLPMSASGKFLKFRLREQFSKSPDVPGKERIL